MLIVATTASVLAFNSIRASGDTIYTADGSGAIKKIDSNGMSSVFANAKPGEPFAPVLAIDSAGNLYAGYHNSETIVKFTPNGSSSVFATTSPYIPEGLTLDSAGNLYATLYQHFGGGPDLVRKFTPGAVASLFSSISTGPGDLAFDPAGNLYVVTGGQASIEKLTPGGVRSVFATGNANSLAGGFSSVACDSNGNVYASAYNGSGGSRIVKYTPSGVASSFAEGGFGTLRFGSADSLYVQGNGIETFTLDGLRSAVPGATGSLLAVQAVPEPSCLDCALSGLAIVGLGLFVRRPVTHRSM